MKIITLCGSTKFRKDFENAMAEITLRGDIVLSVGVFSHEVRISRKMKHKLDMLHFRKIDMSDEIFVVNPGGYIGLSTCDEIHYAEAIGKTIRYLEPSR